MLDRQHFRGPVWEGKKIPTSILNENNPLIDMGEEPPEPEKNPNLNKKKEAIYETVKR